MTGEEANKAARMKKLLLKLSELAEVLDDITKKMKMVAEKQKRFTQKKELKSDSKNKKMLPSPDSSEEEKNSQFKFPVSNFQVFMVKKNKASKPKDPAPVKKEAKPVRGKMSFKEYIEFATYEEFLKFKKMGPISPGEKKKINFKELSKKFFPSS